jgi:hypothetical protein
LIRLLLAGLADAAGEPVAGAPFGRARLANGAAGEAVAAAVTRDSEPLAERVEGGMFTLRFMYYVLDLRGLRARSISKDSSCCTKRMIGQAGTSSGAPIHRLRSSAQ